MPRFPVGLGVALALAACRPAERHEGGRLSAWELEIKDVPRVLPDAAYDIAEDDRGAVWLGSTSGVTRFTPSTEAWRTFTRDDGLPESGVFSIASRTDGSVLLSGIARMSRVMGDTIVPLGEGNGGFEGSFIHLYPQAGQGNETWATGWSDVAMYDGEKWHDATFSGEGGEFKPDFPKLVVSPGGVVWLLSSDKLYLRRSGARFDLVRAGLEGASLHRSSNDRVWLSGPAGLYEQGPDGPLRSYTEKPNPQLRNVEDDESGGLWLLGDGALEQFDPGGTPWWRLVPGLPVTGSYWAVTIDGQGGVWVVSSEGTFVKAPAEGWLKVARGFVGRGVLRATESRIWVTDRDGALDIDVVSHEPRLLTLAPGLPGNKIVLTTSADETPWVQPNYTLEHSSDHTSFMHLDPVTWVPESLAWRRRFPVSDLSFGQSDLRLRDSTDGDRWLRQLNYEDGFIVYETRNGGIWIFAKPARLAPPPRFCRTDGTCESAAFSLAAITMHEDSRNRFWVANGHGLTLIDGTSILEAFDWGEIAGVVSPKNQDASRVFDTVMGDGPDGSMLVAYSFGAKAWGLSTFDDGKFRRDLEYEQARADLGAIVQVRIDDQGATWVVGKRAALRKAKGATWRRVPYPDAATSNADDAEPAEGDVDALVDRHGVLWYVTPRGLGMQAWLDDGTPKRPILQYFTAEYPRLMAIASRGEEMSVWRTRPTGMLRNRVDAMAFALGAGEAPITCLESATDGGAWIGHAPGGLSHLSPEGELSRLSTRDGLPDDNVRDISSVPDGGRPRAWVATDAGAALVAVRGEVNVVGDLKEPVDVVAALPDGSAWLALNPIDGALYLPIGVHLSRKETMLVKVDPQGARAGAPRPLRGDVLDMAPSPDGLSVWIGTTAGLYRMPSEGGEPERVTAGGRLVADRVARLTVDAAGTVWMARDRVNTDSPAAVVGYLPEADDIDVISHCPEGQAGCIDRGLPEATRIEALATTPHGDLAVLLDGKLFKGPVYVPQRGPEPWSLGGAGVLTLGLGIALARLVGAQQRKREYRQAFRPLLETAAAFFTAADRKVTPIDHRHLRIAAKGNDPDALARATLESVVDPAEVDKTSSDLTKAYPEPGRLGYLVHPRDLDAAARFQLDTHRLRRGTVIVPLPLPYLRAKLAQGSDGARAGLDELHRRYLGLQDLFDVRGAIEEPRFFFGRRALIEELFQAIARREHVAVVGPRKSGKTSLLNLLQQRLEGFPVIKIDLELYQRGDPHWPEKVFQGIVAGYDDWGRAMRGSSWSFPKADPITSGSALLEALRLRRDRMRQLGTADDRPVVILLDEIERVFPPWLGQHTTVSANQLERREQAERFNRAAGVLRALGQANGDRLIALVVADLHLDFNRVNQHDVPGVDTNPMYRFFQERFLTPLSGSESKDMLVEIGQAMGLELEEVLPARIHEDSGGHAVLGRQLASAANRQRGGASCLTIAHYEEGLEQLQDETGEVDRYFQRNLWEPARPSEQAVLLAGASPDGLRDTDLADPALLEARRDLFAVGILERFEGGYRVRGHLFRTWLRDQSS